LKAFRDQLSVKNLSLFLLNAKSWWLADHQLAFQKNFPHGYVGARSALQHRGHRDLAGL